MSYVRQKYMQRRCSKGDSELDEYWLVWQIQCFLSFLSTFCIIHRYQYWRLFEHECSTPMAAMPTSKSCRAFMAITLSNDCCIMQQLQMFLILYAVEKSLVFVRSWRRPTWPKCTAIRCYWLILLCIIDHLMVRPNIFLTITCVVFRMVGCLVWELHNSR